jgi:hypothetical protein
MFQLQEPWSELRVVKSTNLISTVQYNTDLETFLQLTYQLTFII